jgi:hypothetical protein
MAAGVAKWKLSREDFRYVRRLVDDLESCCDKGGMAVSEDSEREAVDEGGEPDVEGHWIDDGSTERGATDDGSGERGFIDDGSGERGAADDGAA